MLYRQIRKTPRAEVQSAKRTHMLILQQRLPGTEMKDLGMFSSIRKTNLSTAQRKEDAAKNQES